MAKFKFKFETLLKQRKQREEAVLRMLGDAQRVHQEALTHKNQLETALKNSLERREALGKFAVPITVFLTEQDYITGTKVRIEQAQNAISRSSRGVEKALRAYLHARRQTRMMENLYDKQLADFKQQQARKERKELEDLLIMRARMTQEGSGLALDATDLDADEVV